jgi:hypothetical protein
VKYFASAISDIPFVSKKPKATRIFPALESGTIGGLWPSSSV